MKILFSTLLFTLSSLCLFAQSASYSFNNGNANDDTGSLNGTVNSATPSTDRFGNANHAYSFDGVDDYIDFGDSSEFQMGTGDFSISLWVKYDSTQQGCIISKRAGSTQNYSQYNISVLNDYQFGGVSKKVYFFSRANPTVDRPIVVSNDLSGAWHHIVIVCAYNDSTSAYVDGQFVGANSTSLSGTQNHDVAGFPLVLGYSSESNSNFFNGLIDDVAIYKEQLSTQQIDSLFNAPNPVSGNPTQVIKQNENTSINLYPNPVQDYLMIQSNEANFNRVELITIDGRSQVYNISDVQNYQLNTQGLESGLYTIRIWKDEEILDIQKFSKL